MREQYQPAVTSMGIYVPSGGTGLAHIKPGSALVGVPADEGHIRCYYEGGVYNPSMDFEEKLTLACGRLADRAPTVAVAYADSGEVAKVGTVEWNPILRGWVITELTDEPALRQWAGDIPPVGGSDEQKRRAVGLIIGNGHDVQAMMAYQSAARTGRDAVQAVLDYAQQRAG
jgi:hypothetical protein